VSCNSVNWTQASTPIVGSYPTISPDVVRFLDYLRNQIDPSLMRVNDYCDRDRVGERAPTAPYT